MILRRFANWLFRLEEIDGHGLCPTYLYRWTLLKLGDYGVYLHHFVADDWCLDLHDHPKRFISIGLRGRYIEQTDSRPRGGVRFKVYEAPWIRTFPAEHRHRILLSGRDAWTLVIVLRAVRPWGFWHAGRFVPWRDYVTSDPAKARKTCP